MNWVKVKTEVWGRGNPMPVPSKEGVYLLVSEVGTVEYVGQTSNLKRRYVQQRLEGWRHRTGWDGTWFVYCVCGELSAHRLERQLINKYTPPGNARIPSLWKKPKRNPSTREQRVASQMRASRTRYTN
jgi:excinuclease UvrABC nuclease subunit